MKNKERIQEWIKAMRSGNYKFGKKNLRYNDAFCALGVACNLYEIYDKRKNCCWLIRFYFCDFRTGVLHGNSLPDFVQDYYGITKEECIDIYTINDNCENYDMVIEYLERLLENDKQNTDEKVG